MKQIKIKKIGNHWYLDVNHSSLDEITLDEKIEKILSRLQSGCDEFKLVIYESGSILYNDTLQFADESLNRYFTTNDDFDIEFWIGDRNFKISSTLYYLLECQYEFNFHDTLYRIELCSITY